MSAPKVESYCFGEIVIDGKLYRKDVLIVNDRVIEDWWRRKGHSLGVEDLTPVLDNPPQILVVGQGTSSRMNVPAETRYALERVGIRVIALPTGEACESYNRLSREARVSAALHLTC
jgi:hypothetical protein